MKKVRQFCAAVVLTLSFAISAYAGQMTTWATEPPPPPSTTTEGQMDTGSSDAVDPVTQVALNLLQSVMSLF
ncbi:MAG TPA: hypothetical protein VF658_15000 [Pyrinomonadaceae bacterium]|jgi:hypothetical protein